MDKELRDTVIAWSVFIVLALLAYFFPGPFFIVTFGIIILCFCGMLVHWVFLIIQAIYFAIIGKEDY